MKDIKDINIPSELRYAKDHEWLSPASPHRIGVSDFAQDQLGDLTFVELPQVGTVFTKRQEFGSLESIKSVSSVYAPVDGKVSAVNPALADDPGLVNRDPYGQGWLIEFEAVKPEQAAALLDAASYRRHLEESH